MMRRSRGQMRKFREESHKMCWIIWCAAFGCLFVLLFLCPSISGEKWVAVSTFLAAAASFLWAAWASPAPPYD